MAADVSFADWSGPVKNPAAGGSVEAVTVKRIDVVCGSNVTRRQIENFVEVITVNRAIGPAIATDVRQSVPPVDLHFEQRYANLKAIAKTYTPAEAVLHRVQEILVQKMQKSRC